MVALPPETLDRTFAALAHPIRRSILSRLSREGTTSISDLAELFDVTLVAVSRHVRVMEEAGLLVRRKDGRVHRMRIDPAPMERASEWIEEHRVFWERQLEGLARYIDEVREERE